MVLRKCCRRNGLRDSFSHSGQNIEIALLTEADAAAEMALSFSSTAMWKWTPVNFSSSPKRTRLGCFRVKASLCNGFDDPILKEVVKEPVAFMGGMFAGLLRLDLNEDPLKEWVTRTVEASGITEEEIDVQGSNPEEEEEAPQPIVIE